MNLIQYIKKQIKLTDIDGKIFAGHVTDYTSDLDNDRPFASIALDMGLPVEIEIYENEIKSIEIIE